MATAPNKTRVRRALEQSGYEVGFDPAGRRVTANGRALDLGPSFEIQDGTSYANPEDVQRAVSNAFGLAPLRQVATESGVPNQAIGFNEGTGKARIFGREINPQGQVNVAGRLFAPQSEVERAIGTATQPQMTPQVQQYLDAFNTPASDLVANNPLYRNLVGTAMQGTMAQLASRGMLRSSGAGQAVSDVYNRVLPEFVNAERSRALQGAQLALQAQGQAHRQDMDMAGLTGQYRGVETLPGKAKRLEVEIAQLKRDIAFSETDGLAEENRVDLATKKKALELKEAEAEKVAAAAAYGYPDLLAQLRQANAPYSTGSGGGSASDFFLNSTIQTMYEEADKLRQENPNITDQEVYNHLLDSLYRNVGTSPVGFAKMKDELDRMFGMGKFAEKPGNYTPQEQRVDAYVNQIQSQRMAEGRQPASPYELVLLLRHNNDNMNFGIGSPGLSWEDVFRLVSRTHPYTLPQPPKTDPLAGLGSIRPN